MPSGLVPTKKSVFVVLRLCGEVRFVKVKEYDCPEMAAPDVAPQLLPLQSETVRLPVRFVSPVIVTLSLGSHLCADAELAFPPTTTSSVPSGQPDGPAPLVFGELPLYDATKVYVPTAVGSAVTAPYDALSPETVTGDPVTVSPEALQLFGPLTEKVIEPPAAAWVPTVALIVPPGPTPSVPGCFAVPVRDAVSLMVFPRVTSGPAVVVSTGVTGFTVKHSVTLVSPVGFGSLEPGTPLAESPEYTARQQ